MKLSDLHRGLLRRFRLTTDGFDIYLAVESRFGAYLNFPQLIKSYGKDMSDEWRYFPSSTIGIQKRGVSGDLGRVEGLHIAPQEAKLTMLMQLRRLTRLTDGFSKGWGNLRAVLALHFGNYGFCWKSSTTRMTLAMKPGTART